VFISPVTSHVYLKENPVSGNVPDLRRHMKVAGRGNNLEWPVGLINNRRKLANPDKLELKLSEKGKGSHAPHAGQFCKTEAGKAPVELP
jgi:hypothetical protein